MLQRQTRAGTLAMVSVLASLLLAQHTHAQSEPAVENIAGGCLKDLRAFNRELVDSGYGVAGPSGYGVTSGRGLYGAYPTPRGQMGALIDAAHVFALSGMQERCATVLEGARQIYQDQLQAGQPRRGAAFRDWRRNWLAAAIPATEWQGDLRIERIDDADVRNLRDEDLGDVDDVIVGPEGRIRYVLVGRGGFLGLGEALVPLPWSHVRITPSPYADTLVIPVAEETFEQAPTLEREAPDREVRIDESTQKKVDRYWSRHLKSK